MLFNYLKVTLRGLVKNRVSTIINLLGLSIGICTSLIVYLVITYEVNFDSFHSKSDRIYRVVKHVTTTTGEYYSSSLPYPMAEALLNEFPDVKSTQIFATTEYQFKYKDDVWEVDNVLFADSSFFSLFDFAAIEGNPSETMKHPNKMLVTRKFATSHFGDKSPIGESVNLFGFTDIEIAGVLENIPGNSHLPFSVVISLPTFQSEFVGGFSYDNWNASLGFSNYIILPAGETRETFESRLKTLKGKYLSAENAEKSEFMLQPLEEIHFDTRYSNSNPGYTIDPRYLMVLGSVGFFVLLLACINFINLSTAVSVRKSKEVGVRKTMGASRSQLVYQYIGEALMLTLAALVISMGITERLLPILNTFMDTGINFSLVDRPQTLFFIGAVLFGVTALSGYYPAWILSKYEPVAALKNKVSATGSSQLLRKVLVTSQFVISQVLIIGTIVIAQQMDFFRNKPLGFDKDLIIGTSLNDQDTLKMLTLKNKLLAYSGIQSVGMGLGAPTSENDIGTEMNLQGSDESYRVRIKTADVDYLETFGIQLLAGRWFPEGKASMNANEFVLNESAVRTLGFATPEEALGQNLTIGLNGITSPIVGVVKDFHIKPLRESIEPVVLFQFPRFYFEAGIKIEPDRIPETIDYIRTAWQQVYPEGFFDYYFLDQALAKNYDKEEKLYQMFQVFSLMSIGIGCLGLFGLISYLVIQKTKEVGVRKVLGASVSSIVVLFSRDFIRLILIAFVVAVPAAWYLMDFWLSDFAYRIDLNLWYFTLGGLINLVIALATISYQALKAATVNPVESLKYE